MLEAISEYTGQPPELHIRTASAGVVGNVVYMYQLNNKDYKVTYYNGDIKIESLELESAKLA